MPTEAQKRANKKYQQKTVASLACRVKKEQAEQFRAYCDKIGQSPNAVIKAFVMSCINQEVTP